jgi:hypothetical protein
LLSLASVIKAKVIQEYGSKTLPSNLVAIAENYNDQDSASYHSRA